jgi:hypothetical protein
LVEWTRITTVYLKPMPRKDEVFYPVGWRAVGLDFFTKPPWKNRKLILNLETCERKAEPEVHHGIPEIHGKLRRGYQANVPPRAVLTHGKDGVLAVPNRTGTEA